MAQNKACTLIINNDRVVETRATVIKQQLETGSTEEKKDALKQIILLTNNGEKFPQLLMPIIRFVMPVKDHSLKKLLLLFWEVCDKTGPDGKLLHEMILICDALRRDLVSPNEYVRGSTLRFLCKLKEPELLEPLISSILENLDDRHSYVRRNAILCVYSIFKNFDYLIPDAPERIFNLLPNEGDASCKRNGFIMLFNCDQEKAVEYLGTVLDQVSNFGDILQFIVVELIRKVCKTNPSERAKYIRCIFSLLNSSAPSVQFESASTLVSLTGAPTAIKAASSTFIKLLCDQSDNNVKMIVLDRLESIRKHHAKVLQTLLMDILRALAAPNMDVRRKTLDIALNLVTPANVDEVVQTLKKEIHKTQQEGTYEKAAEYREMLIRAIHQCAAKYPMLAGSVVNVLMDFLGDASVQSAVDVIIFVREVMELYPDLQSTVLKNLLTSLKLIKVSRVYRAALWIIGEYSRSTDDIDIAFSTIREELGDLRGLTSINLSSDSTNINTNISSEDINSKNNNNYTPTNAVGAVLADGTYASQSAFTEKTNLINNASSNSIFSGQLRVLLLSGDFFLASVLSTTLTKLVLRSLSLNDGIERSIKNGFSASACLVMVSLLKMARAKLSSASSLPSNSNSSSTSTSSPPGITSGNTSSSKREKKTPSGEDSDSLSRIWLCIKLLTDRRRDSTFVEQIFLQSCRDSFAKVLGEQQKVIAEKVQNQRKTEAIQTQPDDLINIRQLLPRRSLDSNDDMDSIDELCKVTGFDESPDMIQKLDRLYQLTGMSDPVYAEAYVMVHRYDIVLDVMVLNQTADTLQNLSLELATLGDLKLCERPQSYTIGPFQHIVMKANIKVSSTDTGIIFGNIVYDIAGTTDSNCVVLNEIHIDIMDYISPASCTDAEFRAMWAEFEWENKLAVNTTIGDINAYLEHLLKSTNMACLTPEKARDGDCGFLSANLYAKSVFGEDALANLSIEKKADGKLEGSVRIRSRTQGIALSLGDKITLKQKTNKSERDDRFTV